MSETEFMEFSEVDNHDDYYSIDEEGQIHVRDERGCYVMYDAAIDDMRWQAADMVLLIYICLNRCSEEKTTPVWKSY